MNFSNIYSNCETNATFCPFSKNHGHSIDCNDAPSTIDRWKAFQSKLKLLKIIDEVGLVSKGDPQNKGNTLCGTLAYNKSKMLCGCS
jgi:hypothetical protein